MPQPRDGGRKDVDDRSSLGHLEIERGRDRVDRGHRDAVGRLRLISGQGEVHRGPRPVLSLGKGVLKSGRNLKGDVDRMVADVLGEVGRRGDGPNREDVRLVQRIREGVGGRLIVLILDVQGHLRRTRRAKDRTEQEDQQDREDERKEGPDSRADVLGAERLHVCQYSIHAASTPSCMRAPTRFRKTSSRLARLV